MNLSKPNTHFLKPCCVWRHELKSNCNISSFSLQLSLFLFYRVFIPLLQTLTAKIIGMYVYVNVTECVAGSLACEREQSLKVLLLLQVTPPSMAVCGLGWSSS